MISYEELDNENDNLNFWNSMIKKCVLWSIRIFLFLSLFDCISIFILTLSYACHSIIFYSHLKRHSQCSNSTTSNTRSRNFTLRKPFSFPTPINPNTPLSTTPLLFTNTRSTIMHGPIHALSSNYKNILKNTNNTILPSTSKSISSHSSIFTSPKTLHALPLHSLTINSTFLSPKPNPNPNLLQVPPSSNSTWPLASTPKSIPLDNSLLLESRLSFKPSITCIFWCMVDSIKIKTNHSKLPMPWCFGNGIGSTLSAPSNLESTSLLQSLETKFICMVAMPLKLRKQPNIFAICMN